jgi:glutamate-1-semialdehyde 2,1-aminomutase
MGTDSGEGREREDREFFAAAERVLVGGVSASARINPALGRAVLVERGDGPYMIAPGGAKILDFHGGFGASFLGHNHPGIRAGIEAALDLGMVLGPETEHPRRLAEKIVELVPGAELVRYSNSGSEATMSAIRLARAHTGRKKILKFEGHFHGLHELVNFSTHPPPQEPVPGELIAPTIDSAGIPKEFAEFTLVAPWRDLAAIENAFARHPDEIAAVIVEPVNYNSGCLVAEKSYMEELQRVVREHGALLIYDEILSGFRMGTDCAQGYYGVTPDVTVLGKAVAGGMPLSVLAGKREVMETFSPLGGAAHSGTYTGHLLGVMAATAVLEEISRPGFYDGPDGILAMADRLYSGLREIFTRHGIRCRAQGLGARFGLYFGLDPEVEVRDYHVAASHDMALLSRFVRSCFAHGLYFHSYDVALGHHGFGGAHTPAVIDEALARIESACAAM